MTPKNKPLRGIYRSALALAALAASSQAATIELEPVIVSALRVPQASSTVTSAVTSLDPEELESQGVIQLRDALNASPGVISTSTAGQSGAVGTLLIRGTTTSESLMVVDGIRMNGSGNQLGNFFSSARSYDLGSLEILRGPQSSIYGGESIGGVVWMETPRGSGEPSARLGFEAGSFNSLSTYGKFEGESNKLSYFFSGGYEETDNDAPASHFHQGSTALRVETPIDATWTLGTTFRAVDAYYENGGLSDDHFDTSLSTIYATGKISDVWTTRFNLGYQQESYDSDSSTGTYFTDLEAFSLSTDQEIKINDQLRLLAGGFFHHDSYQTESDYPFWFFFSEADRDSNRYGLYSALEWDASDQVTSTASIRWEDYDTHGQELTWRLGSVYRTLSSDTALRGSIGTAFRAPSYLDLYYANSFGQTGNPNLESQTAIGWDLGITQKIGNKHAIEATYFRTLLENAIDSFAFPSPVNIPGTTATDGLEFAVRGNYLDETLSYRLAWTYLHHSLKDQPHNAATATLQWQANDRTQLGIGGSHLSNRSWGGDTIATYTTMRIFSSYQLTDHIKVHARIENALDEQYELSSFFGTTTPAAGIGYFAGLTIDW